MPRWEWLLGIMVLAEMVWILSSLFRGTEEERKGPGQRAGVRRGDSPANRPRPTASNVDQFLEEINRRRREAAERQGTELSPGKTAARKTIPRPDNPERRSVPLTQPLPSAAARPRFANVAAPPLPSAAIRAKAESIVVRPDTPAPQPDSSRFEPPAVGEVILVSRPVQVSPVAAAAETRPSAPSTMISQLVPLLRTNRSLQAAVMLHEILGPPRCRRFARTQSRIA